MNFELTFSITGVDEDQAWIAADGFTAALNSVGVFPLNVFVTESADERGVTGSVTFDHDSVRSVQRRASLVRFLEAAALITLGNAGIGEGSVKLAFRWERGEE